MFYRKYLYLKQKVNKFVQLNGEFIVKPPDSSVQLLLNDYQKTKQNEDHLNKFLEGSRKSRKKRERSILLLQRRREKYVPR